MVNDISKMRGQLIGMTQDNSRFFGHKISLHSALRWLSRKENPPLLLIKGKGHVGKTRFVKEICQYFYMHNEFRHAIMLHDLQKVDSEERYVALITKLSYIIKSF